jgi:putative endonuclease
MTAARIRAEQRGRRAEALAAWFLRMKGYRILARRFKTPVGEIDLVAKRGGTLAIVEIKARADLTAGVTAVTPAARRRIVRATEAFLNWHGRTTQSIRFDVVVMRPWRLPRHIPDAWRPDMG